MGIFDKRENYKPFEYPEVMQFVDMMNRTFWVHSEVEFTADIQDFKSNLTSEEKERLIEFKKSDKLLKVYKQIKEEIGLEERKKLYFRLKVLFCLFLLVKFFPLGIYLSFFAFIIFMTYAVLKEEKKSGLVDTYALGI